MLLFQFSTSSGLFWSVLDSGTCGSMWSQTHLLEKNRDGLSFPAPVHAYLEEVNLRPVSDIPNFVQGPASSCPWPQSHWCGLFTAM